MGFIIVDYEVWFNGQNVILCFDFILKLVEVDCNGGEVFDECMMILSDVGGCIVFFGEWVLVFVNIRGFQVFKGFVFDINFEFNKGGG